MREPAHDDLVARDHLLPVDAEVLARLVRPARDGQAPGDQRRRVARPAGLHRQPREIDVVALPHDLLAGRRRALLRRHVQHLHEHRARVLPRVLQALAAARAPSGTRAACRPRAAPSTDSSPMPARRAAACRTDCRAPGSSAPSGCSNSSAGPPALQHAIADLGHLEARIDGLRHAPQLARCLELGDEVAEVAVAHWRDLRAPRAGAIRLGGSGLRRIHGVTGSNCNGACGRRAHGDGSPPLFRRLPTTAAAPGEPAWSVPRARSILTASRTGAGAIAMQATAATFEELTMVRSDPSSSIARLRWRLVVGAAGAATATSCFWLAACSTTSAADDSHADEEYRTGSNIAVRDRNAPSDAKTYDTNSVQDAARITLRGRRWDSRAAERRAPPRQGSRLRWQARPAGLRSPRAAAVHRDDRAGDVARARPRPGTPPPRRSPPAVPSRRSGMPPPARCEQLVGSDARSSATRRRGPPARGPSACRRG